MTLESEFGVPVGYSDHAYGSYPAVCRCPYGCQSNRKTLTLDKKLIGPDHKASSTPEEFRELVKAIRICETSLGSSCKICTGRGNAMRQVSRKSIFVVNTIRKGSPIRLENLTLRRPGNGIIRKVIC